MKEEKEVNDIIFDLVDTFASEYKWTLDEILKLPVDVMLSLYKKIHERKKRDYKILAQIIALAVNCGFSGDLKPLEKLFEDKTEISKEEYLSQLRSLWITLGKDPKELEEKLKKGETIVI